jgi:plastocyanin
MKKLGVLTLFFIFIITMSLANDIKGKIKAKGTKHSGGAVVYVDEISGKKFDPPKNHVMMDQKNLVFIPHILPIVVGTTVDFMNDDDVLHNVFSPDGCAEKFNLGSWPKGQTRSYTFRNQGCVPVLLCNVHPEMEAYIVTLQNPYFAVSEQDGNYVIKNVPSGKYTVKIWHEKLKGSSQEVTVPESGDVVVDFEIKR